MLSLTKKSDAQPLVALHWHPNFRNFERLPDTKVVRTAFFVNTAAIVVAASLLLWVGYREYQIRSLRQQIADAQGQIDGNIKQNNEALRLSKIFADENKKAQEAIAVTRAVLSPADLIVLLGQSLPKEISIETVDMRPSAATNPATVVRGIVAGTPDQAAGIASNFLETLRAHPRFAAAFDQITLPNLARDPKTGFLAVEIVLRYKSEGKEQKK